MRNENWDAKRKRDTNDPRFKKLKESNIATWHMNVLFMAAAIPIIIASIIGFRIRPAPAAETSFSASCRWFSLTAVLQSR